MKVHISNQQADLVLSPQHIRRLVKQVIHQEGETCDEVSVYFVDTAEICRLHELYFNDPSATDCISFPLDDEETPFYRILGEVFVCPATALTYAAAHQVDPLHETALYIVHGLLHLMGYDDFGKEDQREMRQAEEYHMRLLKNEGLMLQPPRD